MKKNLLYKYLLAALFVGCFFLFSCENDTKELQKLDKKKESNTEIATDIKMNYTLGGKAKALLTAPIMIHVEDTVSYYEFPKTLYAEFYNMQEQKESKLTAMYGKYQDEKSIVFLRDSVKIINILKGDTIYCEDLYWDRSRTGVEFYTNKKVQIRQRDGQFMNGYGMEADQAFKNYHLTKGNGAINSRTDGFPK
jgi:LPS export ABC transporter protein LptC